MIRAAALSAALLASPALAEAPPVWKAITGDRAVLESREYSLSGVTCPPPDTDPGRAAKALLNTFLRNGHVACRVAEGRATCRKEGRDVAAGLIASGHCRPAPAANLPEDAARLLRDTGRWPAGPRMARTAPGACDASRRFVAQSRAAACDAGSPDSLCRGAAGLRQQGRYVAPSGRYLGVGAAAPSFDPFHCR